MGSSSVVDVVARLHRYGRQTGSSGSHQQHKETLHRLVSRTRSEKFQDQKWEKAMNERRPFVCFHVGILFAESELPVLVFPEGASTNGKVGLLKFR